MSDVPASCLLIDFMVMSATSVALMPTFAP